MPIDISNIVEKAVSTAFSTIQSEVISVDYYHQSDSSIVVAGYFYDFTQQERLIYGFPFSTRRFICDASFFKKASIVPTVNDYFNKGSEKWRITDYENHDYLIIFVVSR